MSLIYKQLQRQLTLVETFDFSHDGFSLSLLLYAHWKDTLLIKYFFINVPICGQKKVEHLIGCICFNICQLSMQIIIIHGRQVIKIHVWLQSVCCKECSSLKKIHFISLIAIMLWIKKFDFKIDWKNGLLARISQNYFD